MGFFHVWLQSQESRKWLALKRLFFSQKEYRKQSGISILSRSLKRFLSQGILIENNSKKDLKSQANYQKKSSSLINHDKQLALNDRLAGLSRNKSTRFKSKL